MKAINLSATDLEAFLAVADAGSFRGAAKALGISQPSVTARIRHAEDLLRVKLFHRTTRKVLITAAGDRLRVRAERTLAELRAILQEFHDESQLRRGRVDLAATPTLTGSIVPPVVKGFMKRWPGVQVVIHDDIYGRTLGRLISGDVDMAILPYNAAEPPDSSLNYVKLFDESFFAVVPKDHPIASKAAVSIPEIAGFPIASMPPLSSHWATLQLAFGAHKLEFKPDFLSYNLLSMVGLVRAGICIVVLPSIVFPLLNMTELATIPISSKVTREVGIVTARDRAPSAAAEALIRFTRLQLAEAQSEPAAGADI